MQFCSSQLKNYIAELERIRERQQRAKGARFSDSESPELEVARRQVKHKATNLPYIPPFTSAAVLCQRQHH